MSGRKVEILHTVNADDLWSIIHQEITENGLSHHAIQSANDFYKIGISQIMTRVFTIEDTIDNTRDKTPQDRQIKKIKFRVEFNNIKMKPPITSGYRSGHEKMIFPNQAHIEDRTYASNLYVDAKIFAVAYTHDGQEIERREEVKEYRLVSIPTMVGSDLCNTHNKSRETLIQMKEDPRDAKGYFMKGGKEWSIDNMESICFNQARIFNNYWRNEIQRLEFISKPGDTYQNSKQIIIRMMNNGMITIEIVTPKLRGIQFPFYLIFRALGWATDKEMIDNIVYKPVGYPQSVETNDAKEDLLLEKMMDILKQAVDANYDTKTYKFGGAQIVHSQIEALSFIVKHMPKEIFRDMDLTKEDHLQQAINQLLKTIDEDLLPHVGDGENARHNKLRFVAHLINRMLYVVQGILEPTDRDSYVTKRIHTPGVSIAKTFKTYFNASIVSQIKKQFTKDFKAMSFNSVNLIQTFQISINGADFERLMMQSITSGNQTTLKVNRYRTIINRLSSQLVDRKNYTKVYSTLRMVISPNSDSSKGSDRAKEMRMPHLSFQGFIDLIQSAEGGEKIGLHKQMGISSSICSYGSSESLKETLLADKEHIIPLKDVHPYQIPALSKVFVNGDWIGCAKDSSATIAHYTELRRGQKIDKFMTIEWDNNMDEIYFWVDYGRIRRPVIIVYNNVRDWRALGLTRPASIENYEQGIALTPEILRGIQENKIKMDDLLKLKVIEYLTPGEQIRMDIACDYAHLTHHKKDVLRQFTHCDIPATMLGIASLTGPLSNFNQTPRNTFQTSQTRQTGGTYAFNWAYRIDKDTFLQYQIENPLVHTVINDYIPPNGAMCSVAVACYTGYNEEDSLIFNKITGERLKFNGCWFTYDKVELEKNEQFGNPDITRTTGIKKYANYSKLAKNGIVPVGTIVKKGDIIVGKIKRLPKNIAAEKKVDYSDQSLVYKQEFPAIVHNIIIARDDDATTFCKIAYRSLKPIIIGDKFSARCFTPDHEVLTLSGWKDIASVTKADKVATMVDNKQLVYEHPLNLFEYDYKDQVMDIDTGKIAMTVTMEHKNYVCYQYKAKVGSTKEYTYIPQTTKELMATNFSKVYFKKSFDDYAGSGEQKTFEIPSFNWIKQDCYKVNECKARHVPMDDWLQFFGLWIAEGCVDQSNMIRISICKERVKKILDEIAPKLGLTALIYPKETQYYYSDRALANYLTQFKTSIDKFLPDWCFTLCQRQSRVLLASLIAGDGAYNGNSSEYYTGSFKLAQHIQQLIIHCGWSYSSSVKHEKGEKLSIKGNATIRNSDQYRISIGKTIVATNTAAEKSDIKLKDYAGKVYCLEIPSHVFMVRKKSAKGITSGWMTGNSGQKGVCGLIYPQSNMPFTSSGMIPDMIMNPHSFPKRMTIGQPFESVLGKICAKRGISCDATTFRELDIDALVDEMKRLGMDHFGRERLYCGITGAWIDAEIFTGPVYYQRLQKFVAKSIYSIDIGPTDIITRQPLDGKANQGGLRMSELQRDVMLSHGAGRFFAEKFYEDSDDFEVYVCRCGSRAIVNHQIGLYRCPECGDDADINAIYSSWSSKQFFYEMNAMHIGTRFEIDPFILYDS